MRERICALTMTLVLFLTGCGEEGNEAEKLLQTVRGAYLEMTACSCHGDITADYGQRVYEFGVDITWEKEGRTVLVLTSPENVAGITATVEKGETTLEYDGVMVETGPLDSAGLSPMDALPALLTYAREGYMAECCMENWDGASLLRVTCRDPERDPGQGVEAQLWFRPEDLGLARGEISEDGRTVIQCVFTNFSMSRPEPQQTEESR